MRRRKKKPKAIPRKGDVQELRELVKLTRNRIRVVETDLSDDRAYLARVEHLDKTIAVLTKEREDLVDRHDNGPAMIKQLRSRLLQLGKRLTVAENQAKIEKLLAMQQALNEFDEADLLAAQEAEEDDA